MTAPVPSPVSTVVAIDIGGTTVKSARVLPDGRVEAQVQEPSERGPAAVAQVLSVARSLCDESTVAVGVAAPGLVDAGAGVVRWAANLGWEDVALRDRLRRATGLPTFVEQDVRAAGLAEAQLGWGRVASPDLLMVVLGTGVGAALVTSGRPLPGATSRAGELGHVTVQPDGERCPCGRRGCLEVYSSAGGMMTRYRRQGGRAATSTCDLARGTDALGALVWAEAVDALSLALACATMLLDPPLVVLGGGVAQAGEVLLQPLRETLAAHLRWRTPPRIELTRLGPSAGRVGAALTAWQHLGVDQPDPRTGAPVW